jgi:hypothetical protein
MIIIQQIRNRILIAHAILGMNRALRSRLGIYTCVGGTPSVSERSSSSDDTGGVPHQGGACRGGGAPVSVCLQRVWIFSGAIMSRKAAVRLIFAIHCQVSFDRSLHLVMPGILHTPLLLFSDFGASFIDQLLRILYCDA